MFQRLFYILFLQTVQWQGHSRLFVLLTTITYVQFYLFILLYNFSVSYTQLAHLDVAETSPLDINWNWILLNGFYPLEY